MTYKSDEVVIVRDASGSQERVRILYPCGPDKYKARSLTHTHQKSFVLHAKRILRKEGDK